MSEGISPLIFLAAIAELLAQHIERDEHAHLVTDEFRAELRAFSVRVEHELESVAHRRYLHLAGDGDSVPDD